MTLRCVEESHDESTRTSQSTLFLYKLTRNNKHIPYPIIILDIQIFTIHLPRRILDSAIHAP
jgi:hypothetical protein